MTQALTPEIMFLYQARPKWRGAVALAPTIMGHVEAIRSEIRSGEDSSGWGSVGGWRAGQPRPGFTKTPPQDSFRGGKGGGGGFMNRSRNDEQWETAGNKRRTDSNRNNTFSRGSGDMPRFRSDDPAPASVPLQSSRTMPAATRPPPKPFNDEPKTNAWTQRSDTVTKSTPQNTITPPQKVFGESTKPTKVPDSGPRTYVPYKSMFKNTEDSIENTVVNTIIQDKLNKLSVSNYEDVRDFLFEILDAGETDAFLADFMKLIFHKAADSIGLSYCPLYARLLHELSAKYGFIQTEINAIYGRFLLVFNEVSDADNEDMDAFRQRNKEKKYRIGYSQFITELLKYEGIISDTDYIKTVTTITQQMGKLIKHEEKKAVVEEYADCLAKMIKILHTAPEANERLLPKLRESCDKDLREMTVISADKPGLSNKARFAVMAIRESLGA
jgi:hypothetical protein